MRRSDKETRSAGRSGSSLHLCGETGLEAGSGSMPPEPSLDPCGWEDAEENEPESESPKGEDTSVT